MKIVTVNIPEAYLPVIERLTDPDEGLYPSRSELIRFAVRDYLIRELKMADNMAKYEEVDPEPEVELDPTKFVQVPTTRLDENDEPVREFKTYKIIRRLEYQ